MSKKSKDNDCDKNSQQIKCISFQAEPKTFDTEYYKSNQSYQTQSLYNYNQIKISDEMRSAFGKNNWGGSSSQYGDDVKVEVTNQISENVKLGVYGTTDEEYGVSFQYKFE